jgi:SAM-dependent methyltransferase
LRIKPDWASYLHRLRTREIERIFRGCPAGCFRQGLELGAGDGFQSGLLARYVRTLVVTDFYETILQQPDSGSITHRVCDAERVGEMFSPATFDLVFSSNVMEHLPHVERAVAGVRSVLREDGLAIHVLPSPFWKVRQMAGFYPEAVIGRMERYTSSGASIQKPSNVVPPQPAGAMTSPGDGNNPKLGERRYRYLRRLLWATPHGVSASNWMEFAAFRPLRWVDVFGQAGFEIVAIVAGPVSSGYGFGLDPLRSLLERLGLASEYAYIMAKAGHASPYARFFRPVA